ncbi:MAG: type II secretion system inner membrane protein GspF [Oligoflexia bacterium]|nr:type II secretion system inner membrane protein GspF [Oligoflexia bacterium]
MPVFEYRGVNSAGKTIKGNIESDNVKNARAKLKKDGVFVTELKDKKQLSLKKTSKLSSGGSVSVQDLSLMTRQLATLIKSQIPLVDALAALVDQVDNLVLRSAVSDIRQMVTEGSSFHKALGKYPKIFSNIYISMCEAGEMSGTLDIILIRLAEFTEKQNELRNKVRAAMMYPMIMAFFGFAVMIVMFVVVIPKVTQIFEDLEKQLPWYTEVLIGISKFIADYWLMLIIGFVASILMFLRWSSSENGRPKWDAMKLKIPVVGKLVRMIAVSRFAKTLSTLLAGGVPMLNAFDIVKNVVDNKVFERVIIECRDQVSEGNSVAGPLKKSGEFPPIVTHMVNIGEKTGELENMLTQVSEAYDFQVNVAISGLTSILEPIMLIFMGLIVGFIVFSIMIPILEMSNIAG